MMYLQRAGHGGVTESVACRVSLGRRLNVRALAVRLAHKTHLGRLTNKQQVHSGADPRFVSAHATGGVKGGRGEGGKCRRTSPAALGGRGVRKLQIWNHLCKRNAKALSMAEVAKSESVIC